LPLLYREVIIPSAVYAELTAPNSDLPPAVDLTAEPWLRVAAAIDRSRVQELREELDLGESEASCLQWSAEPNFCLWMKGVGVGLLPPLAWQLRAS